MNIAKLDALLPTCLAAGEVDIENVPDGIKIVDVFMMQVAVDLARAESHRRELIEILSEWGDSPMGQANPLEAGPSYLAAGIVVDDPQRALVLFAVGDALGFWNVRTPADFGITGQAAAELVEGGLLMIDGYRPEAAPAEVK